MNILINYPRGGEAGPAFSLELAKGFIENGHSVYAVLISGISNENEWNEVLQEENIYWVKPHKNGSKVSFVLSSLRFAIRDKFRIKKKFKEINFDYNLRTFYSHWAFGVDRCVNHKKIVSICHDPIPHSGAKNYARLNYDFYHNSDNIIVLTESFIELASKRYNKNVENIHYVPHGRMNMYNVDSNFEKIQKNYDDKFHFLFFGRIEIYKGLHVLAEAYKIVSSKYDNVALTILGSGDFTEYKEEYNNLPNVYIINRFIKDDEVGNYFAVKNTISVIPYIDATQSGVIPIAFEYGTPVIASDVGGLKEQLNNGRCGLLYSDNDPQKLANCMMNLIDDSNLFAIEKNKMLEYREEISWDKIAKKICDAI